MSKFFKSLSDKHNLNDFADILDWVFDDLKFSGERKWNGGYVSLYTQRIKKIESLSDKNARIVYEPKKKCEFHKLNEKKNKNRLPIIVMSKGECFARDFTRHIRNGIAHNEATILDVNAEMFLEIVDYSDKSKSVDKQTAYILIPMNCLEQIYELYIEINNSIMNTKKKDIRASRQLKGKKRK